MESYQGTRRVSHFVIRCLSCKPFRCTPRTQRNTKLFCPSCSTSPSGGSSDLSSRGHLHMWSLLWEPLGNGHPFLWIFFLVSCSVVPWPSIPIFRSPVSAVGLKFAAPSGSSAWGHGQRVGAGAWVSWLIALANTGLPFYLCVVMLKPVGSLCCHHQMPPSLTAALGRGHIPRRGPLWGRGEKNPIS